MPTRSIARPVVMESRLAEDEVPLRNAMNAVLRDAYVADCQRGVDRWNKHLEKPASPRASRCPSTSTPQSSSTPTFPST